MTRKYPLSFFLLLISLVLVAGCDNEIFQSTLDKDIAYDQAHTYLDSFLRGNYDEALKSVRYDQNLQKAFPKSLMVSAHLSIIDSYGSYIEMIGSDTQIINGFYVVSFGVMHENRNMLYNVVFDTSGFVAGFHYKTMAHAAHFFSEKTHAFEEQTVRFGNEPFVIEGTLTVPLGRTSFPTLILVHGAGPTDRDLSTLGSKPFMDIAHGLAERGIAVLRYDKRTFTHQVVYSQTDIINTMTIFDEVIEDVINAVDFIETNEVFNADGIHILGHGLGGNQVPRIGNLEPRISSFVILGGHVSPLHHIIKDQLQEGEQKATAEKAIKIIESEDYTPLVPPVETLGMGYAYWSDLLAYNPLVEARKLAKPLLIIQGGLDQQVTSEEFQKWREGLGALADYLYYETLEHLFLDEEGHVSETMLDDLADWLLNQ